jgi:hypothetical protein
VFLESSRYFGVGTMTVKTPDGRTVRAVEPRTLPDPAADPLELKGNDRLDVLAQRRYQDGTRFWHIADANTELEARRLTEQEPANTSAPPLPTIRVPRA